MGEPRGKAGSKEALKREDVVLTPQTSVLAESCRLVLFDTYLIPRDVHV